MLSEDPVYVQEHHPFARVPAYENGSFQLFESRAICRYLVQKYGTRSSNIGSSIETAEQAAIFEQAASVESSYFEPPIVGLSYEILFKKYAYCF
jgi:glutathione S-transferase